MISCSITEIIYNVLKNDEKNIKKYAFLETKTTRISFFYIAFHLGKLFVVFNTYSSKDPLN